MAEIVDVCPFHELRAGTMRLIEWEILVPNCAGALFAMENRCSHDDGPLAERILDPQACTVECPRHGSIFDLRTGEPLTPPAYLPVDTFPVTVTDGFVQLEVE